jgi:hypothetical protein
MNSLDSNRAALFSVKLTKSYFFLPSKNSTFWHFSWNNSTNPYPSEFILIENEVYVGPNLLKQYRLTPIKLRSLCLSPKSVNFKCKIGVKYVKTPYKVNFRPFLVIQSRILFEIRILRAKSRLYGPRHVPRSWRLCRSRYRVWSSSAVLVRSHGKSF